MDNDSTENQVVGPDDVYSPAEHVKVWNEDGIRILACRPDGAPVQMDAVQASLLADRLRFLSEPDFPRPPYEPAESGYGALMDDVCVRWGFCGCIKDGRPLHVDWFIPSDGPVSADQFVEWVFLADGQNPNSEPEKWQKYKDLMKASFIKHMGGEVVDATQLRWINNV